MPPKILARPKAWFDGLVFIKGESLQLSNKLLIKLNAWRYVARSNLG